MAAPPERPRKGEERLTGDFRRKRFQCQQLSFIERAPHYEPCQAWTGNAGLLQSMTTAHWRKRGAWQEAVEGASDGHQRAQGARDAADGGRKDLRSTGRGRGRAGMRVRLCVCVWGGGLSSACDIDGPRCSCSTGALAPAGPPALPPPHARPPHRQRHVLDAVRPDVRRRVLDAHRQRRQQRRLEHRVLAHPGGDVCINTYISAMV